jgi:hypothetical protein
MYFDFHTKYKITVHVIVLFEKKATEAKDGSGILQMSKLFKNCNRTTKNKNLLINKNKSISWP